MYLGVPEASQHASYSEETAQLIDEEIGKLIRESHERVTRTLTERRSTLEALAKLLLKHEVVDRVMLDGLLKDSANSAPPGPVPGSPLVAVEPSTAGRVPIPTTVPIAAASSTGTPAERPGVAVPALQSSRSADEDVRP